MSRPTVAYCLALIEKQNLVIAKLEERLKKVENSQFQRKHDAAPAVRRSRSSSFAHLAPEACEYFGTRSVTREQLEQYASMVNAPASCL